MTEHLQIPLTLELFHYVDVRTREDKACLTPEEYVVNLIQRDRDDWGVVSGVLQGLREAKNGDFAKESILDILQKKDTPPYNLDALLAGITTDNCHAEMDCGKPVGNEVW